MILVTGATGTIGRHVLSALVEAGVALRATTRRPEVADVHEHYMLMDLADRSTVEAAVEGVDVVILNSSQHPSMAEHQIGLIRAAQDAGVGHIVKVSAGSAATGVDSRSWVGRAHAAVEARVRSSRSGWTILRPNYFMQNLLTLAPAITAGTLPMALQTQRLAVVDARDIAAVAATVARAPRLHHEHIYDLTGPESLTGSEMSVCLSEAMGIKVRHEPLSLGQLRANLAATKMPDWLQEHLIELMSIYAKDPTVGDVSPDVEKVTGRAPHSLLDFAKYHSAFFGAAS
ncbi:NAD(P)H-binding protein [Nocardia zapadnayensis]|uniref:NmrA family NAD(P)-binding protein n=1 Tax=Nocardia rhamnosiphila TaxID=426716 RepID=UPI0022481C71|nr:NAD(P)H-binding protein [Nocardia zapadnayensis]MCX0275207.1 NAD(P)H-binding protein [Nocardia zapadnayensis]